MAATQSLHKSLPDPKLWIRHLILHKGQADDPLKATLNESLLANTPSYDAISYYWGSDDLAYTIEINQASSVTLHRINTNLHFALRRFRLETEDRTLSNDAICINQKDDAEKADQVGLMGEIYTRAQKVLIYLGEPDTSTSEATDLMDKIHEAAVNTPQEDLMPAVMWMKKNRLPLPTEPHKWEPLKTFFRRPWFRRKWIVQECALAKCPIFHCGQWERSWEFMEVIDQSIAKRALGVLDYTVSANLEQAYSLQQSLSQLWGIRMLKMGFNENKSFRLLDLAYHFRASVAKDPRDHLFSLIALTADSDDPALKPDYASTATVLRTCVRYARYWLEKQKNLEVLYWAGLNGQKLLAPSWIPDWYGGRQDLKVDYAEDIWNPICRPPVSYHVAKGTVAEIHYPNNPSVLGVKGVFIDHVIDIAESHTTAPSNQPPTKDSIIASRAQCFIDAETIMSKTSSYPNGDDVNDAFWRTLICNIDTTGQKAPESLRQNYDTWRKFWLKDPAWRHVDASKSMQSFASCFSRTHNWSKLFGLTRKGFFGLFPLSTERNDRIAVFYGGDFPFVLRRIPQNSSGQNQNQNQSQCGSGSSKKAEYQLVGQCYIHGIMEDGQLDLQSRSSQAEILWLGGDYQVV